MTTTTLPKRVSGGDGEHGHIDELTNDPIGLFWRVRKECGDVGMFQLAGNEVVLVSGAAANEEFFRAPDELLDQAAAYPFMTPVFGEGVVFDAAYTNSPLCTPARYCMMTGQLPSTSQTSGSSGSSSKHHPPKSPSSLPAQ